MNVEDENVFFTATRNDDVYWVYLCDRKLWKIIQFVPGDINDLPAFKVVFRVKHLDRYLLDGFFKGVASKDEEVSLLESAWRVLEPAEVHLFDRRPRIVFNVVCLASFRFSYSQPTSGEDQLVGGEARNWVKPALNSRGTPIHKSCLYKLVQLVCLL